MRISDWSSDVCSSDLTYTQSRIKVVPGDTTVIHGVTQDAANYFFDGAPLTGQSDHLVLVQIGLEDTDRLSQQTLLLTYALPRVPTRGPPGHHDLKDKPVLSTAFVHRQGLIPARIEAP